MANGPQPTSTTTHTPNYSDTPLREGRATTYTRLVAPQLIAQTVPSPALITKVEDQLLILKFRSQGDQSKFLDTHRETTFKTTAYFTTFIENAVRTLEPTNLSLLAKEKASIEVIFQQLHEIWGQENVERITITVPLRNS